MRVNAAALKAIRERTGWSQTAIAEAAEIPRPNYAHIEAGRRPGTAAQIVRLAAVLEVPVTALTSGVAPEAAA